jgi:CheY-like chemotaxis protein
MSDMSGVELAVELMKIRSDIPIILCTGYSKKIPEKKAKELGFKDYILKPLEKEKLAKAVRQVLNSHIIS